MYNIVQKKQILIYFKKHENSMHFYKLVDYNLHEAKNKEKSLLVCQFSP